MKKVLFVFGIILLLALGFIVFVSYTQKSITAPRVNVQPSIEPITYKAGFAIFTNGTYRIFSDAKYHNQSEDVYMEKANIITVKKRGIKWDDFFATLPMSLEKNCLKTGTGQTFCTNETQRLRFFINGQEDPNALDKEIKVGDKLLVTYGSETEAQIQTQLNQIPNTK